MIRWRKRALMPVFVGGLAMIAALGITFRTGGATVSGAGGATLQSEPPPAFAAGAFDAPSGAPYLTAAAAIAAIAQVVHINGLDVAATYTGWNAAGIYHRAHGSSADLTGVPHGISRGNLDVWKVVVGMTTEDPGGAYACPSGATAQTCPALRVYHHMVFLVDDATDKVLVASPY